MSRRINRFGLWVVKMVAKKISTKRAGKKKRVNSTKRALDQSLKKKAAARKIKDNAKVDIDEQGFLNVNVVNERESQSNMDKNDSEGEVVDDVNDEQKDVDKKGTKMIVLSTINDISEVGKLHEKWQEHLSGPIMVIEASAVEQMDTSVLQLLCALIKDTEENGVDVEWKDPSEKLKHAVKLLGLNGPLKLH